MKEPKYRRVLLKLSGEAMASKDQILDFEFMSKVAEQIKKCVEAGVQVAVIVGAGNLGKALAALELRSIT